jgi:hypothetical protein
VTCIAVNRCVSADQRESILVLVDRMNRHLPAIHSVTQFALRSVLSAMDVGMAVLAALAHITKQRSRVALAAAHFRVHPAKGITRFVVIELRNAADRLPSRRGVALLAGECHRAMRILGGRRRTPFLPSKRDRAYLNYKEHFQEQMIALHNLWTPAWIYVLHMSRHYHRVHIQLVHPGVQRRSYVTLLSARTVPDVYTTTLGRITTVRRERLSYRQIHRDGSAYGVASSASSSLSCFACAARSCLPF